MVDDDVEEVGDCWIDVEVVLAPVDPLTAEWHEPAATIAAAATNATLREPTLLRRYGILLLVEVTVRAPRHEELASLRAIERLSGQRYRDFGLDSVADDEPATVEVLRGYSDEGRAWVAAQGDGGPIGYILVDEIDGAAHIEQVSVLPDHQGHGVGRALIERAAGWAVGQGMNALTLTTFGHIPWNRPLYEHLGFRVIPEQQWGPGLRAVWDHEARQGLDPALRVVMRRELDATMRQ